MIVTKQSTNKIEKGRHKLCERERKKNCDRSLPMKVSVVKNRAKERDRWKQMKESEPQNNKCW